MCFNKSKSSSASTVTTTTKTTSNIRDERVAGSEGAIVAAQGGVVDLTGDEAFAFAGDVALGLQELAAQALDFGGQALDRFTEAQEAGAARQTEFQEAVFAQLDESDQEAQEGQVIRLAIVAVIALGAAFAITRGSKK